MLQKKLFAEIFGIREALSWIKINSWDRVELKTDCLSLVQTFRSKVCYASYTGSVIATCMDEWRTLNNVIILFVKRSANIVARSIARASCSLADCIFEEGDFSPPILAALIQDAS